MNRENELAFFTGHTVFRNLNATLYGVDQLSKKLTTVLVTKIKQELVSIVVCSMFALHVLVLYIYEVQLTADMPRLL